MSKYWIHLLVIVILGYVLGYYFRGVGNMTFGKLVASK